MSLPFSCSVVVGVVVMVLLMLCLPLKPGVFSLWTGLGGTWLPSPDSLLSRECQENQKFMCVGGGKGVCCVGVRTVL